MSSAFGIEAFPQGWNGIVPCVSTRLDVEKRLGKDSFPKPDVLVSYGYKRYRVTVHYHQNNLDAPKTDIVKKIDVYPDRSILLAKYVRKIPDFPSAFTKREIDPKISHLDYLAYYFNATENFEIVVQKNDNDNEVVTGFGYYGPSSECSKWKVRW